MLLQFCLSEKGQEEYPFCITKPIIRPREISSYQKSTSKNRDSCSTQYPQATARFSRGPSMASLPFSAIFFTLLIAVFCQVQSSYSAAAGAVQPLDISVAVQREFDYFLLAVQWPATYCRTVSKCCSQNGCCRGTDAPTGFTIHGLWADYNDGTWPSCCNGPQFDETKILPLMDALYKYWPTLSCSNSSTCHGGKGLFWGHEWEKHGTCEFPYVKDEYDYFIKALNLYFKYNVTEMLSEAGYVASNSAMYPLEGIMSAVKERFHGTPEVECTSGAVEEIRLCFNKKFEPQDCIVKSTCPTFVSLPVFDSAGLKNGGSATTLLKGISSI